MLLGVKSREVYSDTYQILEIPPGGRLNHFENINNFALYHGFYPVSIKTDHSDHLYQIRTCDRLKDTINFGSHFLMIKYRKDEFIKTALSQVYNNNEHLKELYTQEEFKFDNLEYIYEELLLRGVLTLLKEKDEKLLALTYHLFMYARYFSNDVSIASIMEPFVHRMLKKLKKYESQTTKKRVKHKKRLLIFSASQKIMIGMHHLLFDVNHHKLYVLIKFYLSNEDTPVIEVLEHIERDKGIVLDGTNLIFEIYKAKEEMKFQGGQHKNLTFHHTKETESMVSSKKGNVFYAVRGRLNGKEVKVCGEDFEGECNMEKFVEFLWSKVSKMRPDRCEKHVERIEAEQLWSFLTFIIIVQFCFVMYYGFYLSKINRRKAISSGRVHPDDDTMVELTDTEQAVSFKYYETLDTRTM